MKQLIGRDTTRRGGVATEKDRAHVGRSRIELAMVATGFLKLTCLPTRCGLKGRGPENLRGVRRFSAIDWR